MKQTVVVGAERPDSRSVVCMVYPDLALNNVKRLQVVAWQSSGGTGCSIRGTQRGRKDGKLLLSHGIFTLEPSAAEMLERRGELV
jgi:hypothetical protein